MGKRRDKKILHLNFKSKSRTAGGKRRNWLDFHRTSPFLILSPLGAIEILESVQRVCRLMWRNICKNQPLMWRTIDMHNDGDLDEMPYNLEKMCRLAVDRSCGTLVYINVEHFGTDDLLKHITDSCRGIRRLRLVCCWDLSDEGLSKVAPNLPLLEELEVSLSRLSGDSMEVVGRSCPLLKSFKMNGQWYRFRDDELNKFDKVPCHITDCDSVAIAGAMHGLHHLQLFWNQLTNEGLKEIVDCCPHLESLDLRHCLNLDLSGDLGKRCVERIQNLLLPNDSIDDYEFLATSYSYGPHGYDMGAYGFSDDYWYDDYDCYDEHWCFADENGFYDSFTKIRLTDCEFD